MLASRQIAQPFTTILFDNFLFAIPTSNAIASVKKAKILKSVEVINIPRTLNGHKLQTQTRKALNDKC